MKTMKLLIKNIVLFSFVLLTAGLSFGQNSLQKAKQMVLEDEYQKAITLYNDYFQSNKSNSFLLKYLINNKVNIAIFFELLNSIQLAQCTAK